MAESAAPAPGFAKLGSVRVEVGFVEVQQALGRVCPMQPALPRLGVAPSNRTACVLPVAILDATGRGGRVSAYHSPTCPVPPLCSQWPWSPSGPFMAACALARPPAPRAP